MHRACQAAVLPRCQWLEQLRKTLHRENSSARREDNKLRYFSVTSSVTSQLRSVIAKILRRKFVAQILCTDEVSRRPGCCLDDDDGQSTFEFAKKRHSPLPVIFWNDELSGEHEQNLWIERSCGQNLENK